jgi:hypothetical protein
MLITLPATAGTPGTMGMQKLVSATAGRPAMLLEMPARAGMIAKVRKPTTAGTLTTRGMPVIVGAPAIAGMPETLGILTTHDCL